MDKWLKKQDIQKRPDQLTVGTAAQQEGQHHKNEKRLLIEGGTACGDGRLRRHSGPLRGSTLRGCGRRRGVPCGSLRSRRGRRCSRCSPPGGLPGLLLGTASAALLPKKEKKETGNA